ncbi:MAG: hypothetical protein A2Y65_03080 [Deltaproteobacteria bacterium RBG_13_52_11]|nr:MAG: hypothetical protein A2Y65_03080 [Deltaproteobacteria bacterium RBG_13_52_11]
MNKYLITGFSSFVGRYFAEYLEINEKNCLVQGLDIQNQDFRFDHYKNVNISRMYSNIELIGASPRKLLNIFQADLIGCHIITATNDILKKLELIGKDLHEFSLETVKMFRHDALKAGYVL